MESIIHNDGLFPQNISVPVERSRYVCLDMQGDVSRCDTTIINRSCHVDSKVMPLTVLTAKTKIQGAASVLLAGASCEQNASAEFTDL